MQIMTAVLARDYDWAVDLEEPFRKFPFPGPVTGMPMTFSRLNQDGQSQIFPLERP